MISSFFEGRVRLRHPALKEPGNVAGLTEMLGMYPGVLSTSSNLLTGSLLVHYDPEMISKDDLAVAAKMLEEQIGRAESAESGGKGRGALKSLCKILPRRQELLLLNASFALCLLGLLGSRKVHAWAGGAFALLTLMHILRRR